MRVAIACQDPATLTVLREVISSSPQHHVAWVAGDAADAVRRCARHRPDVLLMGLEMPGADITAATRRIMAETPCGIIIVTSSVERDSAKVFAAMGAGAVDVVAVPRGGGAEPLVRSSILDRIRMAGMLAPPDPAIGPPGHGDREDTLALVAIGASAGGPPAIARVLRDLSPSIPAAIVVVQHVDPTFSHSMAHWFESQTPLPVRVARRRERLEAGKVYVAAGDQHLVVHSDHTLGYVSEPKDTPYCPSADVLFDSIAKHWRGTAIGILLSGMGSDGAQGLCRLRGTGARTIAQDRATSAVYGMPRAAAQLDAASDILPLPAIGALVNDLLKPGAARKRAAAS